MQLSTYWKTRLRITLLGVFACFMVGCVSIPEGQSRVKKDPWESMNRNVFAFNEQVDRYAIKPLTQVYEFILPEFIRDRISNVFANIGDIYTAVHQLLQGKPQMALDDVSRVLVNTTLGLGGLFDVASAGGLEKHKEDFGQTFGVWGAKSGPYLVLPLLGPSSVRDAAGWFFDLQTDILLNDIQDVPLRNTITGLRVIDQRAKYLSASSLLDDAGFDQYTFVRDAFLQRRLNRIYDGNPPLIDTEEDLPDALVEQEENRMR